MIFFSLIRLRLYNFLYKLSVDRLLRVSMIIIWFLKYILSLWKWFAHLDVFLIIQVDFAMDVFKNLYPDQDVPEGLFSFDKVTFKQLIKAGYKVNDNKYVHVHLSWHLISAVLLKCVLWIDWTQMHSVGLPVVKVKVLHCPFCNFVMLDHKNDNRTAVVSSYQHTQEL